MKHWCVVSMIVVLAHLAASQSASLEVFDDFGSGIDNWVVCEGDPGLWSACDGHACVDGLAGNQVRYLCLSDPGWESASQIDAVAHFPDAQSQLRIGFRFGASEVFSATFDNSTIEINQPTSPTNTYCSLPGWSFPHTESLSLSVSNGMITASAGGSTCQASLGSSDFRGKAFVGRSYSDSSAQQAWFDDVRVIGEPTSGPSGAIAYWPFDGTATDATGNGYDAEFEGDPIYVQGRMGQAIELDGSGDWVDIGAIAPALQLIPGNVGTVAFWFKATPGQTAAQLFLVDGNVMLWVDVGNTTTYSGSESMCWAAEACMAFLGPELGHDYYLDGDWHHVAVVMGTDFNKMYIDGAQVSGRYPWTVGGSPASGGCMWPSSISRVEIGRDYLQSGFFDGAIDEVRVYGRALSATEVNQLHSQVFDNECEQDVLEFSGLTWDVSCRNGNPGNGCFSSSTDSVWIENPRTSNERLHLKVRQLDDGRWCQAEVTARIPANYGRHRFDLTSGPWEIDENVVIGMFLYRDFPAQGGECIENGCQFDVNQGYCLCEIDIEITGSFDSARCTNVLPPPSGINLFYTVQPNRDLFLDCRWFPLTGELNSVVSTHTFDWRENQVMFQSWEGHCDSPPCVGAGPWQTSPWIYDEQNTFDNTSKPALILNLWAVPPIISEYEVVFDRFYSDWIYRDDFESGDTTAWYGGAP